MFLNEASCDFKMKIDFNPRTGTKKNSATFKICFSLCMCVYMWHCVHGTHVRTLVTSGLLPLTRGFWDLAQQAHVASALVRFTWFYLLRSRPTPASLKLCWEPGETRISSNSSKSLDFFQSPAPQASTSPSAKVIDIHYYTWLQCTIFKSTRNQV